MNPSMLKTIPLLPIIIYSIPQQAKLNYHLFNDTQAELIENKQTTQSKGN